MEDIDKKFDDVSVQLFRIQQKMEYFFIGLVFVFAMVSFTIGRYLFWFNWLGMTLIIFGIVLELFAYLKGRYFIKQQGWNVTNNQPVKPQEVATVKQVLSRRDRKKKQAIEGGVLDGQQ